jgi:opacity protein-like surface antigen
MRKTIIAGLILLSLTGAAVAGPLSVQVKGSYFFPSDSYFKSIYGSALMFGAKAAYDLKSGLGFWLGVDVYSKSGTTEVLGDSSIAGESTKLSLVPVTAGVRYVYKAGRLLSPYVGVGLGYFFYKESNSIGTVSKSELGFAAQAGVMVYLGQRAFLDIQGSYSSCKVNPSGVEAQLGGFSLGLGLGVAF